MLVFMNFKNKLAQKHKHTMNQFWFGDNQCQIFALLTRFLNSSFKRRFLFSSLESVVKSNVTVFVYTKRKQKQLSVQFWSFCLRTNGPVNYK